MKIQLSIPLLFAILPLIGAADLQEPPVIRSSGGALDTVITLERKTHSRDGLSITSRLFNGLLPGPTLRIQAGDILSIHFQNNLIDQGIPYRHNRPSAPDESNLHFHGLHISGEEPSDDATLHIGPGQTYDYFMQLPSDHMPGTHWMHPHRHGSTALQVGGGAALAVIVEDPPGYLPSQVANAKEVLLVINQIDREDLQDVIGASSDGLLSLSGGPGNRRFVLTNGQINPTIRVNPGEWIRLRVVFAGWVKGDLGMTINGCEMQLLSKDGIYIRDFPRSISSAPVVPGGRADIMVRCMGTSQSYTIGGWMGSTIATIVTSAGPVVQSSSLAAWTPTYPSYMGDLTSTPATNGCSCPIRLDDDAVNGVSFQMNQVLHAAPLGAVIERVVEADDHPYHQHVYPYQLVQVSQTQYNKVGDWHDSILGTATVRHAATRFAGKIMIHCHRLEHEDEGMMAMEWIDPNPNSACACGFRPLPSTIVTNAPLSLPPVASPITSPPIASPVTTIQVPTALPTRSPVATAPTPTVPPAASPTPNASVSTGMPVGNSASTMPIPTAPQTPSPTTNVQGPTPPPVPTAQAGTTPSAGFNFKNARMAVPLLTFASLLAAML